MGIFTKVKMYFLLNRKTELLWNFNFIYQNQYIEKIKNGKSKKDNIEILSVSIQKEIDNIKNKTLKRLSTESNIKTTEKKFIQEFFNNSFFYGKDQIIQQYKKLNLGELAPTCKLISGFVEDLSKLKLFRFKSTLSWEFLDEITEEDANFLGNNGRKDIKELYDKTPFSIEEISTADN